MNSFLEDDSWLRILASRGKVVFVTGPESSGRSIIVNESLRFLVEQSKKVISLDDSNSPELEGVKHLKVDRSSTGAFAISVTQAMESHPEVLSVSAPIIENPKAIFDLAWGGVLIMVRAQKTSPLDVLEWLRTAGISPLEIAERVSGILAQNLVRRLCTHCVESVGAHAIQSLNDSFGPDFSNAGRPVGCEVCKSSGYYGYELIYNILEVDSAVKSILMAGTWDKAVDQGGNLMTSGYSNYAMVLTGLNLVRLGLTTIEEVELRLGKIGLEQLSGRPLVNEENPIPTAEVLKLGDLKASYWQSVVAAQKDRSNY